MEYSKRMDRFGESIFTVMKNRQTAVEQQGREAEKPENIRESGVLLG